MNKLTFNLLGLLIIFIGFKFYYVEPSTNLIKQYSESYDFALTPFTESRSFGTKEHLHTEEFLLENQKNITSLSIGFFEITRDFQKAAIFVVTGITIIFVNNSRKLLDLIKNLNTF
ncbi:hypothetical protein [Paenisporosarcina cavernae]|uniref:Uncharacterized protein n=1 Tax=Paenisporosarcina cavernae TaxID=2320858 RepID=A0A385YSQ2_9BACL|nr:hypothetical protein [Paenisporosarcina cavernae]AYC28708.1 hypothetical protein D3873_02035 [Paenisporosarcina cavernae]